MSKASGTHAGLGALQRLDLSLNPLRSLEAGVFASAPRLAVLTLDHTALRDLHTGALANLTHLQKVGPYPLHCWLYSLNL
jgi:Leucine-rich repeat (LRR) protein